MDLSSIIMRWILRNAPPQRREWARAMQAEFETLTRGRLVWALGCLRPAIGWCLQTDAIYVTTLMIAVVLGEVLLLPQLVMIEPGFDTATLAGRLGLYAFAQIGTMIVATVFGFWRKDRVVTTAILVALVQVAYVYLYVWPFVFHRFGHYIHWSDLPPGLGEVFHFAVCLLGSALGYGLRLTVTAMSPKVAARR